MTENSFLIVPDSYPTGDLSVSAVEGGSAGAMSGDTDNGTRRPKPFFSWKRLWFFTGPGFLMSIAYLDPGNIESDLQSGAVAEYKLLWVLLAAHILGFFLQKLSAELGVVAGKDLAEMARLYYPRVPRLVLWIMIEIAIICSDMQEVIGTAIAFYLLSKGAIPLYAGVLITMVDTFTFLFFDNYGIRRLEMFFCFLIATMAASFGWEFFVVKPEAGKMFEGMVLPWCEGCGQKQLLQAISVVGAVIMPHNLYLHSALVKSRTVDRRLLPSISEANFYYALESGIALTVSFIINVFVVTVFAHGLYNKTNNDILAICNGTNIFDINSETFPPNNETVEADIYRGGLYLGCQFGIGALFIWAIGIMAAGQSSTMTGTYAGQFVMEGFLHIEWPRWRRVLVTRAVAIVPTIIVAFKAGGIRNLTGMNDLLNCVQMIQLPFALLPIMTFTAHTGVMYEYVSSKLAQAFFFVVAIAVVSINFYFASNYIMTELGTAWFAWVLLTVPGLIYAAFVLYLTLICLHTFGTIQADKVLPKALMPELDFLHDAPWKVEASTSEPMTYTNYGANEL
uniref:Protein Malvolio n=1 Tax=Panagrellus redivivus TaxID=6233 RepID=A0A7E4VXL6_PANRE